MNDPFNIIFPLQFKDVDRIWVTLRDHRFKFAQRHYTYFTASRDGLHITVYEKGPKMLVQGNEARDFAEEVLEPLVAGWVETDVKTPSGMG